MSQRTLDCCAFRIKTCLAFVSYHSFASIPFFLLTEAYYSKFLAHCLFICFVLFISMMKMWLYFNFITARGSCLPHLNLSSSLLSLFSIVFRSLLVIFLFALLCFVCCFSGVLLYFFLSDHSKWAVSVDRSRPYICIGTINRMKSQLERGGGTVCLSDSELWTSFHSLVASYEACSPKFLLSDLFTLLRSWCMLSVIYPSIQQPQMMTIPIHFCFVSLSIFSCNFVSSFHFAPLTLRLVAALQFHSVSTKVNSSEFNPSYFLLLQVHLQFQLLTIPIPIRSDQAGAVDYWRSDEW